MNKKNYSPRKKLDTSFKYKKGTGRFFVTIVCSKRKPVFGKVVAENMELNEIGKIVEASWLRTESIFAQVDLGMYILMPNHMHAIVTIREIKGHDKISLDRIIHSFKTNSSNEYHRYGDQIGIYKIGSLWHRSYNETWIRRGLALTSFEKYILQNPKKWP